jgi:hypothetical protein
VTEIAEVNDARRQLPEPAVGYRQGYPRTVPKGTEDQDNRIRARPPNDLHLARAIVAEGEGLGIGRREPVEDVGHVPRIGEVVTRSEHLASGIASRMQFSHCDQEIDRGRPLDGIGSVEIQD